MARGFRLFGRGSTSGAGPRQSGAPDGVESGFAAENEARRKISESEADSQADANEVRRRTSEDAAREQAIVNEARRQASDSEARRQAEANESRRRAQDDRSQG